MLFNKNKEKRDSDLHLPNIKTTFAPIMENPSDHPASFIKTNDDKFHTNNEPKTNNFLHDVQPKKLINSIATQRESNIKNTMKLSLESSIKFNQKNFNSTLTQKNFDDSKSVYSSKKGDGSTHKKHKTHKNDGAITEISSNTDSFDERLMGKGNLKEILENLNKESKLFNMINDSIDILNGEKFCINQKDENNKYEIIDKNRLQKMKEDNVEIKEKKIKSLNSANIDIIKLKNEYNQQEKVKEDEKNNNYYQEKELKDMNILNEKINDMVVNNRMKKQNIIKTLYHLMKKNSDKIPRETKLLFEGFQSNVNLDNYYVLNNSQNAKKLQQKIVKLQAEIKLKNKELENVRNILNDPEV